MVLLSKSSQPSVSVVSGQSRIRLGFVPLVDCAPLVVAAELGWFKRGGLNVALSRELGWASVRDKIIYGELDAAHALGPMVFLLSLGLGGVQCPCFTPLVLSAQGNGITISRELWDAGVRDARSLHDWRVRTNPTERLTFGIVFPYSAHHVLLRQWLLRGGVDLEKDVRFVVVPPPQMVANLKAGHLHGYCAGEPWNQVAAQTGLGARVASSAELAPSHPEKVLLLREEAWAKRNEEMLALTATILEACAYCADAANAEAIADLLAERRFIGVSRAAIVASLLGDKDSRAGRPIVFHGTDVNDPTLDKAGWIAGELRRAGLLSETVGAARLAAMFRSDLFQKITPSVPKLVAS
jgi:ABC-type nitrate/sulfonate/bicarbonate transport system substrate-binding protein